MRVPIPSGPAYPLSREEFRRALATGHGRAKIHVARFGAIEFREEILEAARVCKILNIQDQGLRTEWLADLCAAAGVMHEVVALPIPEDDQDLQQRADLLREFAVRGVAGARAAMYACFGRAETSGEVSAIEPIIALDGEAGLLFVARALGSKDAVGRETWISSYQLSIFDDGHGEGAGRKLLESAAATEPSVRAYLDALDAEEELEKGHANPRTDTRESLAQVLESIRANNELYGSIWVQHWGRSASRKELQAVLDLLLSLTRPYALVAALRCLGGAGLPPLHPRIFELTRHEDDEVSSWAARVLSKHSLPGVRACGLEALARGDILVALEILTRSAQVDDVETLLAALRPLEDPHEEHGVAYGLLDLFKHSPEVCDARLASYVYDRTPCMSCRERAVEVLVRRGEAPRWLLEECASDGSHSIRERAHAAMGGAGSSR